MYLIRSVLKADIIIAKHKNDGRRNRILKTHPQPQVVCYGLTTTWIHKREGEREREREREDELIERREMRKREG